VGTSVDLIFTEPQGVVRLHTDEGKVSQILRNFISNALKFTTQGEVRVSAHMENEETVVFAVADTGIGIAPENISLVFREFGQVDGPLQDKARGTGLGLPLCRNLAQLLAGKVTVESELGKGSTFYAHIPIRYKDEQAQSDLEQVQVDPERVPVLIVEDNEKNRKLIRDLLQAKGYQTIESDAAEDGIKLAQERKPALILMDIQLPGMDGVTALKQLKAAPATQNIPVMAITASAMTYNRVSMLAEGFDGYQIKPFNLSEFLADVARLIDQNQP